MIAGRCGGCAWFKPDLALVGKAADGYCHCSPPQVVVRPGPQGQVLLQSMFPPVQRNEWCGDWQNAEEETTQ
jgi:hypothetical protein